VFLIVIMLAVSYINLAVAFATNELKMRIEVNMKAILGVAAGTALAGRSGGHIPNTTREHLKLSYLHQLDMG
jgi:hypothetical protein